MKTRGFCVYMTQTVSVLITNTHWRELEYGKTVFILSPLFTVTIPTLQNVYHVNLHPTFRNNVTVGSSSSILKWNVIVCLLVWMEFKYSQTDQEFQLRIFLINHRSSWNPIQYIMTGTYSVSTFGQSGTNSDIWRPMNWTLKKWDR